MMPEFWEYRLTTCDSSAIRFVADQDRDSTEKQLEGDPRLLTYRVKPQTQFPVMRRPSVRVLQHLRRLQIHKTEVNQMHDSVVTINNTNWPAHRKKTGTLVDLRVLDPADRSPKPRGWSSGQISCANSEYQPRSSTQLQSPIRRVSSSSRTCRTRHQARTALGTKTQLNNQQLEPGGASCPKSRTLAT